MQPLTIRPRPARGARLLLAVLLMAAGVGFLSARPAHAASSHQVVMSGYAFGPRALTITAGDTVTWVNQDQAPHDVKTISGPDSIHSPMLAKGASWSHTFTTPGTYGYVCTVHPGMTAQLLVQAAPAPTAHPTAQQHAGRAPAPAAAQPTRSTRSAATATGHTGHGSTAAAAAPASGTPSAAASQQATAPTENTASAARPLDPLLLLAGIVAGVAVLCLLLVGSRSAATGPRGGGPASSS
ncbi:cupredoxin domain-containing protein [Streptomyces monashensis]|uniref:Blue (type 1) copper domain-containing protein n=1 Tax=Streptomyces monashensis TaxID=1678012 RepID=A0A1S2Q9Q9_9ACTN|nr:cupredoxin family copper-binding protein [Streptomyces monashensis]OIK02870.1 hypothetical protein BIV23_24095 [Streptomyces monashensis]